MHELRHSHSLILGGGLAGALLALLLAQRGLQVHVLERRADPRRAAQERGRSINLALAARGIDALEFAGLMPAIQPLLMPMRGRHLHEADGSQHFLSYGQRPEEEIYAISRHALNCALLDAAAAHPGVTLSFGQRCVEIEPAHGTVAFEDMGHGTIRREQADVVLACDGAGSVARRTMVDRGLCEAREEWLPHGYIELTIPADAEGRHRLAADALHIWPRGGYMLIALPNPDGSFTCTLFLPYDADPGFTQLREAAAVETFFRARFPDTLALMPELVPEFLANPVGRLGTVRTRPWHAEGRLLLLGDAAHPIVPFHGQGMNCAFEDCRDLARLIDAHGADWPTLLPAFEALRRPSAEAIADMALENYVEMRDTVRDPRFALKKALAFELERAFPAQFIPRYSMVMFHPEISYAEAQRRGARQDVLLEELTAGCQSLEEIDLAQARRRAQEQFARPSGA